jgi:hypothetical protein
LTLIKNCGIIKVDKERKGVLDMYNNYDVEVIFEMSGKNQFGKSDTLQASRYHSVQATSEEQAIDVAKTIETEIEIVSFSVCKR